MFCLNVWLKVWRLWNMRLRTHFNPPSLTADLPLGWKAPRVFSYGLKWRGIRLKLVGLRSQSPDGAMITASAGSGSGPESYRRASFELIERIATWEAWKSPQQNFQFLDGSGRIQGKISKSRVFPKQPSHKHWRYALSNGIAAHESSRLACDAAACELVERDRVLRYWYAQTSPRPWKPRFSPEFRTELKALEEGFEVLIRSFPSEYTGEKAVVGFFGFPKKANLPLTYGFGSGDSLDLAYRHAMKEAVQRMGFLWGIKPPNVALESVAEPEFHMEHFRHEAGLAALRKWLEGEATVSRRRMQVRPLRFRDIQFADISPKCMQGKWHVVKAIAPNAIPLTFGRGNPKIRLRDAQGALWIHPIA